MVLHVCPWCSMHTHGAPCMPNGAPWCSMHTHGAPCTTMVLHVCPMVLHAHPRCSMNTHGAPCTPMLLHTRYLLSCWRWSWSKAAPCPGWAQGTPWEGAVWRRWGGWPACSGLGKKPTVFKSPSNAIKFKSVHKAA